MSIKAYETDDIDVIEPFVECLNEWHLTAFFSSLDSIDGRIQETYVDIFKSWNYSISLDNNKCWKIWKFEFLFKQ